MISPCGFALRLELVERGVDRRERELHAQPVERRPGLDVGAQPMLFVLGEHAEQPGIELVLRDRRSAAAALSRRDTCAERERAAPSTSRSGLGRVALLGGEDAPVELDGPEEEVEHRRRELDAPEPQIVEQVLELVREARHHARRAEEPREPLQRVDRAEDVVDELRIAAAPSCSSLVEREQIAAQPVDDLLRFGEELSRAPLSPRPPPPSILRPQGSLAGLLACASPGPEQRRAGLAELLRRERLRDVRVRAERQAALDVALRRTASR